MVAKHRNAKRIGTQLVSSVFVFQQIAATSPAFANGSPGHTPFASGIAPNLAPPSSSADAAPWQQNHSPTFAFNHMSPSHVLPSHVLPASFGMVVTTLPTAQQTLPLPQTRFDFNGVHRNSAHMAAFQSGQTAPQHNLFSGQLTAVMPRQTVQLDLTSSASSIVLNQASVKTGSSVTVQIGGGSATFQVGDKVTAAELVAIQQAQTRGGQTIEVDQQGRATGGTFSLNSVTGAAGVTVASVVVPNNVTAVDHVHSRSNVNLSGDLVNYGSIVEVGSKYSIGTAAISAMDIINQSGASIVAKNRGEYGLDLSLNASHDFNNLGTISSGGSLSITAGGTLTNSGATITAANDVNLQSTAINNSGKITSTGGNINLGTGGVQIMNVNNAGGTLSAVKGDINVRDANYTGAGNSYVSGGDLLSHNVNLYAGAGTANVNVGQLTGYVNSAGNAVHVTASTNTLKIGDMNLTGDPTFTNASGDIQFDFGPKLYGDDLTVIASHDISSTSAVTSITAVDGAGQGKNITLIAGANVSDDGTTASFDGVSSTGGSVDLSGADPNLVVSTASTSGTKNGGNIVIAAFAGSDPTSGRVKMPDAGNLDASGSGGGSGGNVSVFGGNSTQYAISVGKITNASNVTLVGSQPALKNAGPITYDMATGAKTNTNDIVRNFSDNTFGDVFVVGAITGASNVSIAAKTANLGGAIGASNGISITATKNAELYNSLISGSGGINIVASGNIATFGGNTINIKSESPTNGGNISMVAGTTFATASDGITTLTGSTPAGGHINVQNNPIASLSSKGTSAAANGGNITLFAVDSSNSPGTQGFISVPGALVITSGGGSSGKSGNIYVQAGLDSSGNAIGSVSNTISADTSGGLAGTGNISLVVATPNFASSPITVNSSTSALDGFLISSMAAGQINYTFIKTNNSLFEILKGGNYTLQTSGIANSNVGVFVTGDLTTGSISTSNSITLTALGNVNLGGGITASGGLMAISASNVQATVPNLHITTKSSTGDAGEVTFVAGANFSFVLTGHARIFGPSANGGSVLGNLSTGGDITSIDATSTAAVGGKGGNVTMLAFAGTGGVNGEIKLASAGLIGTSSVNGTSGDFIAIAGHNSGAAITLGNVIASGGVNSQSGAIILQSAQPVATAQDFLDYNFGGKNLGPSPINLLTGTFASGDIAASLLLSKSGSVQVSNNGNVTINLIDVGGVAGMDGGSGGGVIVQNGGKSSGLYIGDTIGSSYIGQIVAAGDDSSTSDGGFVWIKQTGDTGIALKDASSISFTAGGTGADFGGTIILDAGKGLLNLGGAYSFVSGQGVSSGGTIAFTGSDVITTSGMTIEMESNAFGGVASVNISGTSLHKLDFVANAFNMSANDVSFISPNAPLNIRDGFIETHDTSGFGGGKLHVEAKGIYAIGTSPVQFFANAGTNGDGGEIIFKNLSTDPIFIGTKTGDFQFHAPGGSLSGNGGTITVTSGGNLTVDTASAFPTLNFNPQSTTANGGHLTLDAGHDLLIIGSLNADAGSLTGGNGGSITLHSNSTTPFTITTAKPVNGITGTLSAKGLTGGDLSITNDGGPIVNNQAITFVFGTLTESATAITAKGQLGGVLANKISLTMHSKTAAMNFTSLIQAKEVTLFANGSITANKVIADNLNFGSDKSVTIKNLSPAPLKIGASYAGGAITVSSPGTIETLAKTALLGAAINLTSTGDDSQYGIDINGTVFGSGTVTLVAPGDININAGLTGTTGVKITNSEYGAGIKVNSTISAGAKGSVALTSKLGTVNAIPSSSIDAGMAVTLSAPKGLIFVGNIGNVTVPNSVSLSSLYTQTMNGNINFVSSMTAKVTQTLFAGLGDINVYGNIFSSKDTSSINLTTSSFGAVTDINALGHPTVQAGGITIVGPRGISFSHSDVIASKSNLTATVANGYLLVDTPSYFSANFGTTSLTASVDVTIRGQVNGCLGTVVKATSTSPTGGSITVADNAKLTALGTKGVLTITASGGNGITFGKNTVITGTKDTTITASSGSITADTGSTVTAANGKLVLKAHSDITENGSMTGGKLVIVSTTAKTTTNTLTVGNISTADGNIVVSGAGKSVVVSDGALIEAHAVKTTPKATIVIQATNVSKGTSSSITIGGALKTSGPGGSTVSVIIGTPVSKFPTSSLPGFVIDTSKGGIVYGGAIPSSIKGSLVTPVSLTTEGANIILNSPNAVNIITFHAGASVLADPPVGISNATSNLVTLPGVTMGSGVLSAGGLSADGAGAITQINTLVLNLVNPSPAVYTLDNAQLGALSALNATAASSDSYVLDVPTTGLQLAAQSHDPGWISETELSGGAIPAAFVTEGAGGHDLAKGSMLVAPKVDTTVKTSFGEVKIKARSLVLVMAFSQGLAVYNLHDKAKDSVVLSAGGKSISLLPGRHAVVTASARGGFESCNPAQLVCYGPLTEVMLSKELRAFQSEFSLPSMINALPALRNLVISDQPESKGLAREFLKTTSIILQLRPASFTYRQIRKSQLTAYNR